MKTKLVSNFLQKISELPATIRDAQHVLDRIALVTSDLQRFITTTPHPDPTFVYVLPPGPGPMLAACRHVNKPESILFEPMVPIPVGSWVVSAGPARVTGVRVGNQAQEAFNDYCGHVCQLATEAGPGIRITVNLKLH